MLSGRVFKIWEWGAVFLCLMSGLYWLIYQLPHVSATYDEGFSYVANGEYLVKNFKWDRPYILLHPPLFYYLSGISSLSFLTLNPDIQLLRARLSMVPLYIFFALFIHLLMRHLVGRKIAWVVLLLYLFHPEILAHARLVTPDHLLAVSTTSTLVAFYFFLKKPTSRRMFLVSIGIGVTLLSKYTGLLLVPLLCFYALIYSFKHKSMAKSILGGMFIILVLGAGLLHGGYGFSETGKSTDVFVSPQFQKLAKIPGAKFLLTTLLPRAYIKGTDFQMEESSKGVWWGYFMGKYYGAGLWYFYPVIFLIKTPLPLLWLITWALVTSVSHKRSYPLLTNLLLFTILYWFLYMMFFNKLIIGLRYLLPIQPLFLLLIGLRLKDISAAFSSKFVSTLLTGLIVWYVVGILKIAPFYLAFANETIGGPKNLWKYAADSSLDWNQDQKFFADYKNVHPEIAAVNPRLPTSGIIAVQVNEMNLYYFHNYQWLRDLHKEPIDEIGYTWLIFQIDPEELKQVPQ